MDYEQWGEEVGRHPIAALLPSFSINVSAGHRMLDLDRCSSSPLSLSLFFCNKGKRETVDHWSSPKASNQAWFWSVLVWSGLITTQYPYQEETSLGLSRQFGAAKRQTHVLMKHKLLEGTLLSPSRREYIFHATHLKKVKWVDQFPGLIDYRMSLLTLFPMNL